MELDLYYLSLVLFKGANHLVIEFYLSIDWVGDVPDPSLEVFVAAGYDLVAVGRPAYATNQF